MCILCQSLTYTKIEIIGLFVIKNSNLPRKTKVSDNVNNLIKIS